jgi:dienelactone hydrolase
MHSGRLTSRSESKEHLQMFEYFPGNYVWNLGVVAALNSGGVIDEVDRACRPIRDLATQGSDVGTADFMVAWARVADQLEEQATEAAKAGHDRTAGQKFLRAAVYLSQAERMQSAKSPDRRAVYQRCLDLLARSFELLDPRTTRVELPFEGTALPAYFTDASTDGEPAPVMVMWNGLDSTKEHMYTSGFPAELAARGISTLMVDCPGSGEALRFQGLTSRVATEGWAAACVDYLERRSDVRADRIGLVGWSLGGYYAPRAAAFEKRLALCVAWGANHNWGAVQKRRLEREGENPVPHYWDHVLWVWGEDELDTFIANAEAVQLDGVVEKITVPFLIAHGSSDRQIPVDYAHRSYEQAVNSPKRELRIFTPDEGATEHIGLDHFPHVGTFIADWIADTFRELG